MTTIRKLAVPAAVAVLLFMANIPSEPSRHVLGIQLIADANAIFGTRRRTRRRSLAIGYAAGSSAAHAEDADSSSDDSDSDDSRSDDSASEDSKSQERAKISTPQPADADQPLALGAVVTALPSGCTQTASGGIEYYHCGPNYYRAVFQGNTLVYVTAKP